MWTGKRKYPEFNPMLPGEATDGAVAGWWCSVCYFEFGADICPSRASSPTQQPQRTSKDSVKDVNSTLWVTMTHIDRDLYEGDI